MNAQPRFFAPLARLLHWLMALMIIAHAVHRRGPGSVGFRTA